MERQLAGLSSLVHSALVSKGMNERTQRDMAHLRREILALHESPRESSEEPQSLPESLSSHAQHQLHGLSQSVQQAKSDARQLRRMAQVWKRIGNIGRIKISDQCSDGPKSAARSRGSDCPDCHLPSSGRRIRQFLPEEWRRTGQGTTGTGRNPRLEGFHSSEQFNVRFILF